MCALAGPGGQNVNKVSTKVDVRVPIEAILGLDAGALARLRALARTKLDAEGRIHAISQKTRDQARNIEDALDKIRELVAAAKIVPIMRRPTKPTRGSVRRRLDDKRRAGERKKNRSSRSED